VFDYTITSITGWLLIVLLVATIVYPFLLRGGVLGPVQPFLKRMRFHYWLGYGITGIILIHAWVPMNTGFAGHVNAIGLDLATGALFLVIILVIIGQFLSQPKLRQRRTLRQWHLWIMISLMLLVIGHLLLNSGTLQMFVLHSSQENLTGKMGCHKELLTREKTLAE